MSDRSRILGIDLGTTNTCVAHVRNHVAKMVPTDRGNLTLPSVVALSARGELLVGGVAKDQMLVNPRNTIYGAKRLIGRSFKSRVVQELRDHFSYEIVEGPAGEAAVRLGDKVYTLPQISSFVLAHVKTIAEQFLGGPVTEAIISVPAYYNDNQRNAVKEAGRLAGLEVRRIVNEPTAAALAYGFNRGLDQKILVYDLGGGTFDVSVLNLSGNVFEVVATGGDTFLGGSDFDRRIVDWVLEQFLRDHKVDLRKSPIAMQRIQTASEAAKIDLTLIPNVQIELPFIDEVRGRPLDLRYPLSRDQLNGLTADLVDRTFQICDQVLASKGISPREIAEVILVGGQSRMPLVQEKIREHFGKPARKGVHPDECVAQGAALLGDSLGATQGLTLVDVLSMPIGIAAGGGRFRKILDKNSSIPCSRSFRLPPPAAGQADIVMDIFQGESDQVVDNEYLGTLRIESALAGRKIDFRLSEECLLSVVVDHDGKPVPVELATRDTPDSLKAALAADDLRRRREAGDREPEAARGGGLLSSIRRIWSS
ncbi:MAG TPA: Hsp70 family protein [Myxococcales bacterium]|nr:Hsp70 family protein [Myxococcales bacterium]